MPDDAITIVSYSRAALLADAGRLIGLGYDVIPLNPGEKTPIAKKWNTADSLAISAFPTDRDVNLGLRLGLEIADATFLIAFDIDTEDPVLAQRVMRAVGSGAARKAGAKGQTIIARTEAPLSAIRERTKRKYKKQYHDATGHVMIELMSDGFQTVLPPSLHPDGAHVYRWLTNTPASLPPDWQSPSLLDVRPAHLPLVDEWTLDEIVMAALHPDSALFAINDMRWHGPDKGGTVDEALLTSTARMVREGWPLPVIVRRCNRAVAECLARIPASIADLWNPSVYLRRLHALVDGAQREGFEKPKPKLPKDRMMANEMVAMLGGLDNTWRGAGFVRVYRNGHWPEFSEEALSNRLWDTFPDAGRKDIINTVGLITSVAARARMFQSPLKICLLNGTLDLATGQLGQWGREDLLLNQLPFEWSPDAACPVYDAFVERTFSHPEVSAHDAQLALGCFEEFVGYTLINQVRFHKMLVLRGAPRSGKSTLTEVVRMLHGDTNCSAVALNDLSDPNRLAHMDGKMVNISGEVQSIASVDDQILKSIVAGDPVIVKRLYQNVESKKITARLIVAGNNLFRTGDTSGAVEARLLVLRCDQRVPDQLQDPFLVNKLRDERPGILRRVVDAVQKLYARGFFAPPSYLAQELDSFSDVNNPIIRWLRERTHEGMARAYPDYHFDSTTTMPSDDLYDDFAAWIKRNGHALMSSTSWGQRITQLGFPSKSVRVGGRVVRARPLTLIVNLPGRY